MEGGTIFICCAEALSLFTVTVNGAGIPNISIANVTSPVDLSVFLLSIYAERFTSLHLLSSVFKELTNCSILSSSQNQHLVHQKTISSVNVGIGLQEL